MTWEGVPWMVAGGEHSAEVGRLLAYSAVGQGEGVVAPPDCKVVASAIPDGNVNIQPGAVGCLNRFPGGSSQAYLLRNVGTETVALTPQGSSGVRYDLVAVVVEDPQYPGQPVPPSVTDGPYLRTKVYSDVPSDTRTLEQIDANQTGYALALVKFNASDGTVTDAEITDLRQLISPRQKTFKRTLNGVATGTIPGSLGIVPTGASWPIEVPTWANRAIIEARWSGVRFLDSGSGAGSAGGYASVNIGAITASSTLWQEDATGANKPVTGTIMAAEDVSVAAIAGTVQNLQAKMSKTSGTGMTAQFYPYTTVVAEVTFYESLV